jgi:hypothetical protein
MTDVLFLYANCEGRKTLRLDEEARIFKEAFRKSTGATIFTQDVEHAVRREELAEYLSRHKPRVLIISGHGEADKGPLFAGDEFPAVLNLMEDTVSVIKNYFENLEVVIFNCCESEKIALELIKYIKCTIGTTICVDDDPAKAFTRGFFTILFEQNSVRNAYDEGLRHYNMSLYLRNEKHYNIHFQDGIDDIVPLIPNSEDPDEDKMGDPSYMLECPTCHLDLREHLIKSDLNPKRMMKNGNFHVITNCPRCNADISLKSATPGSDFAKAITGDPITRIREFTKEFNENTLNIAECERELREFFHSIKISSWFQIMNQFSNHRIYPLFRIWADVRSNSPIYDILIFETKTFALTINRKNETRYTHEFVQKSDGSLLYGNFPYDIRFILRSFYDTFGSEYILDPIDYIIRIKEYLVKYDLIQLLQLIINDEIKLKRLLPKAEVMITKTPSQTARISLTKYCSLTISDENNQITCRLFSVKNDGEPIPEMKLIQLRTESGEKTTQKDSSFDESLDLFISQLLTYLESK